MAGAMAPEKNLQDGGTLPPVPAQTRSITGQAPTKGRAGQGCGGRKTVGETASRARQGKAWVECKSRTARRRARWRRRAAIEPVIGHLKHQCRLVRSPLKGFIGDSLNLMLAAAARNFRQWRRE